MGTKLLPHHLDDVLASGLSDQAIDTLGFYSGTAEEVHDLLGFEAGPGLVIPYPVYDDRPPFFRVKPDAPRATDGKPAKYLSPKNRGLRLYIPPETWDSLKDVGVPLRITEGEKKAAKADEEGLPCGGIGGVYGFRDKEHQLLPELELIPWNRRTVYLAPDSDVRTNPDVANATWELGWQLCQRGAVVHVVELPEGARVKTGLDDFLLANGRGAFEAACAVAGSLVDWSISRVTAMPTGERRMGLEWLVPRVKALDAADVEMVITGHSKDLGLRPRYFRSLVTEAATWIPKVPRAQREAAESEEERLRAEADERRDETERHVTELEGKAKDLLNDPALLYRLVSLLDRLGLAGERANGCIVYLVYCIQSTLAKASHAGQD